MKCDPAKIGCKVHNLQRLLSNNNSVKELQLLKIVCIRTIIVRWEGKYGRLYQNLADFAHAENKLLVHGEFIGRSRH